MSLVTVYITNFNYQLYIERSIESVLSQTYKNIELIIIDDGSTDNSREIIEKYRSYPNIRIVYQNNLGLNRTNNIAISLAGGKYIVRLDADDFFHPAAIGIMVSILDADDNLGLVFPDYYYVNSMGKVVGEERRHNFNGDVSLFDLPAHGACTMVRLEFLRILGGYNENVNCQDGYDLWIKFVSNFKVTNINRPLFYYRRHNSNLTINKDRLVFARQIIKRDYVNSLNLSHKALAIIPLRNIFYNSLSLALLPFGSSTVLEEKVKMLLDSRYIKSIVISVDCIELYNSINHIFFDNDLVKVIVRPEELTLPGVSLLETIFHSFQFVTDLSSYSFVVTVSIDYPFINLATVDEAFDNLILFKSNTVISAVEDFNTYYTHNGHSLIPIQDHKHFTKYEREALFREVGGIIANSISSIQGSDTQKHGSISHVLLDKRAIFNFDDLYSLNFSDFII